MGTSISKHMCLEINKCFYRYIAFFTDNLNFILIVQKEVRPQDVVVFFLILVIIFIKNLFLEQQLNRKSL